MPTVPDIPGPYRLFFYSFDCHEPPHVHVRREYRLHPVDAALAGMVLHPMAKATDVLRFYREYARTCPDELTAFPDELTAFAALMTAPDGAPVVAIVVGYIGPLAEGERLVAPVRKFGSPLVDTIGPMSYVQLNTLFDAAFPDGGVQRYWKSSFLKYLGDDVLEILVARASTLPERLSCAPLRPSNLSVPSDRPRKRSGCTAGVRPCGPGTGERQPTDIARVPRRRARAGADVQAKATGSGR
jgi:hypothetical protein